MLFRSMSSEKSTAKVVMDWCESLSKYNSAPEHLVFDSFIPDYLIVDVMKLLGRAKVSKDLVSREWLEHTMDVISARKEGINAGAFAKGNLTSLVLRLKATEHGSKENLGQTGVDGGTDTANRPAHHEDDVF